MERVEYSSWRPQEGDVVFYQSMGSVTTECVFNAYTRFLLGITYNTTLVTT